MNAYGAVVAFILTGSVAVAGARALVKMDPAARSVSAGLRFWRASLVCGVINGALTLANPIVGATAVPSSGQPHIGPERAIYVYWTQFILGLALCGLSGYLSARRGQPSSQAMAAGTTTGVVGALVGISINATTLLIAPQTILTYYNALLGEAGPGVSHALAFIPVTLYGLVALISGAILGAEVGTLGGAVGRKKPEESVRRIRKNST